MALMASEACLDARLQFIWAKDDVQKKKRALSKLTSARIFCECFTALFSKRGTSQRMMYHRSDLKLVSAAGPNRCGTLGPVSKIKVEMKRFQQFSNKDASNRKMRLFFCQTSFVIAGLSDK